MIKLFKNRVRDVGLIAGRQRLFMTALMMPLSFTALMSNGLYRGYYAIRSSQKYVAIPSLSFSETREMLLHINYSHDGWRTSREKISHGE